MAAKVIDGKLENYEKRRSVWVQEAWRFFFWQK